MEILTLTAVVNQRRHATFKRCTRFSLPTISEETDPVLWQDEHVTPENFSKYTISAFKRRESCGCKEENTEDVIAHETTAKAIARDVSFDQIYIFTDESHELSKRQLKTLSLDGMNEAKALFPDFFPQSAILDSCEEYSWKSKPTLEQIFSGKNHDFSRENEFQEGGFEFWNQHRLSF